MPIPVSIIIPNRNDETTISDCLEAAFDSEFENFEVVVVDDHSTDNSIEIINQFPCTMVPLEKHSGTSRARNVGADHSRGNILFFTDSDCLLKKDTLGIAVNSISSAGPKVVLGGTYTSRPADDNFFSYFQSVFIHYSECKNTNNPDYVATHAMIINADEFKNSGGFAESFLPILEDVEFSHRLRRSGFKLVINPDIQVTHIFGYRFAKSMCNAFRKSMYWTAYSLYNRDLFKDSGTASLELKLTTLIWFLNAILLMFYIWQGDVLFLAAVLLIFGINLVLNRGLLAAFYKADGAAFLAVGATYYLLVYPIAVGAGGLMGVLSYRRLKKTMAGSGD